MSALDEVSNALNEWVSQYEFLDDDSAFHSSLNFPEAMALANLLIVAGATDLARNLMEQWEKNHAYTAEAYAEELSEFYARCSQAG